ncbi:unnamed protein product [Bemisia tabaci]|uniref:alpha-glucosidase n=1 Tax=Bemisia tabaci TaxID=7038 RepID=A0A9P0F1P2_BEMTA|nr:unnamed protein product [Bemisia tabaci]
MSGHGRGIWRRSVRSFCADAESYVGDMKLLTGITKSSLITVGLLAVIAVGLPGCDGYGIRDKEDPKWWQNMVMYQIYPQSFYDTDGDGFGDLEGIKVKIPYLCELNVTAIWINSFYESPMKDHGYDVSDFKKIHRKFGTMSDFKALMTKLDTNPCGDKKEMRVIMDFVPNHTSKKHEWFQKSIDRVPGYNDYYVWMDPKGWENGKPIPPNNWASVYSPRDKGSAWEWNEGRRQFYLHTFTKAQPDLNLRFSEVRDALKDIMKFWLDMGVDGFRMGAVAHLIEDPQFRDENPWWDHRHTQNLPQNYAVIKEFRRFFDEYDKVNHRVTFMAVDAYASQRDARRYYGTFKAPGAHYPLNYLLLTDFNADTDAVRLKSSIDDYLRHLNDFQLPNWLSGNHDWSRIPSRLEASTSVDLVNMLNLLLPGSSCVYMGDEIGMDSYWNIDKDKRRSEHVDDYRMPSRTPFHWNKSQNAGFTTNKKPWLPVNPEFYRLNVEVERNPPCEECSTHLRNFKELVQLKKKDAFVYGPLHTYALTDFVFCFTRENSKKIYVTLMNLDKEWSESFDIMDAIPELTHAISDNVEVWTPNLNECKKNTTVSLCFDRLRSNNWSMPPKSGLVLSYIKNDPPENSKEDDDDELQTYEDDDYEILKSYEYETDEN